MTGVQTCALPILTALFIVIYIEQWMSAKNRLAAIVGAAAAVVCLLAFGSENFILPAMICIMAALLCGRKVMEPKEERSVVEHAD